MKYPVLLVALFLSFFLSAQNPTRWYVRASATGAGTGLSWTDAFPLLQSALQVAGPGDTVWVAEGTYKPTATTDRNASFKPSVQVCLFGGFAGTETSAGQRNEATHPTVLTGDIGVLGDSTDNSYHVLYIQNGEGVEIDGFIIQSGYADDNSTGNGGDGGGILMNPNAAHSPIIRRCILERNYAKRNGGGITLHANSVGQQPIVSQCTFRFNTGGYGGGLYVLAHQRFIVQDCKFENNQVGGSAAGLLIETDFEQIDTIYLRRISFKENTAEEYGGGMYLDMNSENKGDVNLDLEDCKWEKNTALDGGILYANFLFNNLAVNFQRCQFSENQSDNYPIDLGYLGAQKTSSLLISECIFSKNQSASSLIYTEGWDSVTVLKSTFQNNICGIAFLNAHQILFQESIFSSNASSEMLAYGAFDQVACNNCVFDNNNIQLGYLFSYYFDGNIAVNNCLFYKNHFIYPNTLSVNATPTTIANSIFYGGNDYRYFTETDLHATTLTHCSFDSLTCGALAPGVTCGPGLLIGVDPMFKDTAGGDFRLQPCSPLRNAGLNTAVSDLPTDIDGLPRIQDGTVDIGPSEHPAVAWAAVPSSIKPTCSSTGVAVFPSQPQNACLPLHYAWAGGSGAGATVTGLPVGPYLITLTDGVGNTHVSEVTVPPGTPPTLTAESLPLICGSVLGGQAAAQVSGGTAPYLFHWHNDLSDSLISHLTAGNYRLTVTDAAGCTATTSVHVEREGQLSLQYLESPITCSGSADGSVSVLPLNGLGPYAYGWTGSSLNTATLNQLGPGNYIVTVADSYGCVASHLFSLSDPAPLDIKTTILPATDAQHADGSVVVYQIGGGAPPYQYAWSNGSATEVAEGLLPGAYTLTLTDALGCARVDTFTITYTVGTKEPLGAALRLWPNPADSEARLYLEAGAELRVFSAEGKLMFSGKVENQGEYGLAVSDWPAGIYSVQVLRSGSPPGRAVFLVR